MRESTASESTDWRQVAKISAAFIALIIGSGFATGQEALQFYGGYGVMGFFGMLVTATLLIYTCGSMLRAGQRQSFRNNQEAFSYFCGPFLGPLLAWYAMLFIIAVSTVMTAGAAATLLQAFGLPIWLGAAAIALLAMGTLLLGLHRLLTVLSLIGPCIILLALLTAGAALIASGLPSASAMAQGELLLPYKAADTWWFSGLLYVGLLLPGLAGFIPLLGAGIPGKTEIRAIALIGPIFLMLTLALVLLALFTAITDIALTEVPLMRIAAGLSPALGSLFAIAIFLGVFTTITPLLWTICSRFADEGSNRYRLLVIGLCLAAYLGGTVLPFGQLLNWIYPTVGYVGLVFLICQLYTDISLTLRAPQVRPSQHDPDSR